MIMLVLTRKKDEMIVIDDQIIIKILRVQGGRIRLGIDAPTTVPVRRGELPELVDVGADPDPTHQIGSSDSW